MEYIRPNPFMQACHDSDAWTIDGLELDIDTEIQEKKKSLERKARFKKRLERAKQERQRKQRIRKIFTVTLAAALCIAGIHFLPLML